jgi:effector-binding domain-containing protein
MTEHDVILKTAPGMLLAAQKMTVPRNEQVFGYLSQAFQELWAFVRDNNLRVMGPHMTIWHQGPEVLENEVVEAALEIEAAVPGKGKIQVYTLPETPVASFVHRGKFEDFQIGHKILTRWIAENPYRAAGGYREIYTKHDPSDMSNSVTEIQFPVERIMTNP